jgi:ferric-dicitrate binding protein FerR (iron transport regulator)
VDSDDAPADQQPKKPESPPATDYAEIALWERFLGGESTTADERQIRSWSKETDVVGHSAASVRQAAEAALSGESPPPTVDAQAMLRKLHAQRSVADLPAERRLRPAWRTRRVAAVAGWAAAAAITIFSAAHSGQSAVRSIHLGVEDTGTYRTGPGERLHMRFEDGSQVAAAPNTSVRVTELGGHRSVYVTGEAYVDANDEAARSLVVHAGNALVQNVGARFAVRTDGERREVRIAVATGVVLAGDSGAPWQAGRILTRGTLGVVSALGTTRAFHSSDPDDALVWEAAGPQFDIARLRDALPLTRWQDG